jgi:hypothetical protein
MVMGYADHVSLLLITEGGRSYGIKLTKDAAAELTAHLGAAVTLTEGWMDGEITGVDWRKG